MRSLAALLLAALVSACVAALPVHSDFASSQIAILNSSSSQACLGRCPWCDLLKEYIPSFCVIEDDICLNVMCNLEIANMTFGFHYNLGVCHDPVSVALSVDYSPQKFHADMGPYTASAHVGVPGLTVGLPYILKAGMFVLIDIAGTTGAMDLVMDVALCGEAIGHWLCIPDPPIRVINIHKFDFTALHC